MGCSSRVLGLVLALVASLLLPSGTASPAAGSVASGPGVAVAAATPRGASEDFPRLPAHCYDRSGVITSPCRVTRFPGRPMLVVWGDSHAQMYLSALRPMAQRQRVNLVAILFGGCPVSRPFPRSAGYGATGCDRHNVESLAYVRRLVQRRKHVRLLVNGFWSGYRQAHALTREEERTGVPSGLSEYRKHMARLGVERTAPMFTAIGRLGVPVDLVDQAAMVPLEPRRCAAGREPYQCDLPRRRALLDEAGNERWVRRTLASRLPGRTRIVDPSPTYCNRRTCFAHVRGTNTFYDDIHLGARLTRTMQSYFRPVFNDLTRR
jgi:hypothetical protein